MADTLHAPYLLFGSVLESDTFQNENQTVPSVGATLRLVEAATGSVRWAGVHFRAGDDRETLFGWGRVKTVERLIDDLAAEMLVDFRNAGASHRGAETGRKK
jgi:hypothetical protein